MRTRVAFLLIAGSLLVSIAGIAHAADWRMDLAGSKLEYIAAFQKMHASGAFKEFDMRVRFDANRLADSLVDVTVVMASADMIDADVNKAIRGWTGSIAHDFPRPYFTRPTSAGWKGTATWRAAPSP